LGVAPELAQREVELMARLRSRSPTRSVDVIGAIEFYRLHRISFWDALIVHAARLGGASLFTEDIAA
jgi:predicted nucleic acid-binding protein